MNTKEKAQWLSDFYSQLAKNDNGIYHPAFPNPGGPNMDTNVGINTWQVKEPKPKKQIIDLSMMIDSEIDMEFEGINKWWIGKLGEIEIYNSKKRTEYSMLGDDEGFYNCRIRQDHWHSWQGGKCPLPEGLEIEVIYRGKTEPETIDQGTMTMDVNWSWRNTVGDIIAFKVIGCAEEWEYE